MSFPQTVPGVLSLALALVTALPLQAQTTLRDADAARLARFDSSAGYGLLQALAAGAPQDVQALTEALSGTPQIALDQTLVGDWSCRTMKLGGAVPLVVYTAFKCRLTPDEGGFRFEKLTGSQLTKGHIRLIDGRAVYLGVGHVADAQAPEYDELPADFISDGRVQSDIAIFERVSATRARLMFPAPAVESDFDVLELTR